MKKNILGIKIDDVNIPQIVEIAEDWLKKSGKSLQKIYTDRSRSAQGKHYIVTPNPEILVMAQKDMELKKIIDEADLAIPDGQGLKLSGDIVCNSPGVDVLEALVKLSADLGATVGFLGGEVGVAEKTAERLQKKYKNLKIVFAESGGRINLDGQSLISTRQSNSPSAQTSTGLRPDFAPSRIPSMDILFVAFGPPKQEKWIYKNLDKLPVKVVMGVGGSFDYISGQIPRAPVSIRKLGFEWLFRLMVQPWRIKRQLALFEYIWLLTKAKLKD